MQYPTEIPGVSNQDFLRTAISQKEEKRIGLYDFILKCEKASEELKMNKNSSFFKMTIFIYLGEIKKNVIDIRKSPNLPL